VAVQQPTEIQTREISPVRLTYQIWERDAWRVSHTLDVCPSDTAEVERVAVKYMRKRIRLFDEELNILHPRDCFEAATANKKNLIRLIPESEIDIGKHLETSIDVSTMPEYPANKKGRRNAITDHVGEETSVDP
jgi:hypothetical protein